MLNMDEAGYLEYRRLARKKHHIKDSTASAADAASAAAASGADGRTATGAAGASSAADRPQPSKQKSTGNTHMGNSDSNSPKNDVVRDWLSSDRKLFR